jgi:hypothetical protein
MAENRGFMGLNPQITYKGPRPFIPPDRTGSRGPGAGVPDPGTDYRPAAGAIPAPGCVIPAPGSPDRESYWTETSEKVRGPGKLNFRGWTTITGPRPNFFGPAARGDDVKVQVFREQYNKKTNRF